MRCPKDTVAVGDHLQNAVSRASASKVPEVTVLFWVVKILTTGMGETTSDFLVHRFEPEMAWGLGFAALVISLVLQFRVRRYIPWVYWTAVAMASVFGTMAADGHSRRTWRRLPAAIPAFWFACILTRPLGASFSDWTAVSPDRGGLDWGTGPVSLALAAAIAILVTFLTMNWKRALK